MPTWHSAPAAATACYPQRGAGGGRDGEGSLETQLGPAGIDLFQQLPQPPEIAQAASHLGKQSLRRLEQDLQVKLVKRTPKGVALTAEGSVLLLRVRDLRLSLQGLRREIMDVGEGRVEV